MVRNGVTVSLTLPEWDLAVNTARIRIISSAAQNLNHATTYKRNVLERLTEEVVGACGEIGLAKAFGVWFVPGLNTFHNKADFLDDIESRATHLPTGSLIVRDNDSDARRFVLALVKGNRVTLVGWLLGGEAKQSKWLRSPSGERPAWFVPQHCLHPINLLFEEKELVPNA
jgi:hypothetical protein